MISFENVTKKFGSIIALEDISLDIGEGEFTFLTGHSGAGKTTLIKLLLKELDPDQGKILIEKRDIRDLRSKDLPFYRRKIGVVFQDFKLLPDRTVEENVGLALDIDSIDKSNRQVKVKQALERVGMLPRANLFPRQLSGGEVQRTVIARALVLEPKIILADEPTGNLDPLTAKQIVDLLDQASKENTTTVVMATHNADIVDNMKKRVIELKEGKIFSDKKKGKYSE